VPQKKSLWWFYTSEMIMLNNSYVFLYFS
jgi:hypothetical protein